MRSRTTIEYLGLWEQLNNPNFKGLEFETFKNEAGSNAFTLSPQRWIEATNAIGIINGEKCENFILFCKNYFKDANYILKNRFFRTKCSFL